MYHERAAGSAKTTHRIGMYFHCLAPDDNDGHNWVKLFDVDPANPYADANRRRWVRNVDGENRYYSAIVYHPPTGLWIGLFYNFDRTPPRWEQVYAQVELGSQYIHVNLPGGWSYWEGRHYDLIDYCPPIPTMRAAPVQIYRNGVWTNLGGSFYGYAGDPNNRCFKTGVYNLRGQPHDWEVFYIPPDPPGLTCPEMGWYVSGEFDSCNESCNSMCVQKEWCGEGRCQPWPYYCWKCDDPPPMPEGSTCDEMGWYNAQDFDACSSSCGHDCVKKTWCGEGQCQPSPYYCWKCS